MHITIRIFRAFVLEVFPEDPKQTHLDSICHDNQMKQMITLK